MSAAPPPRPVLLDLSHVRGHVTGLERVALDLFAPERLAPHPVRCLRSRSLPGMILKQQIGIPARGWRDRAAALVFPGFPPGPLALLLGARCLTYVHDTFLLDRPDELNWRARAYMAPSFALAMRFGQRFLVNSRTTGEALRARCRADALVALLRPPVRDVFGLADLPDPAPHRPGETLRLLAIGTVEPRKDYPAALAIAAALRAGGVEAELHIVGRRGWGAADFLDAPPPFLHHHGYLADAALRALVARSHLLLSTSKAEGLGLPLLEVQHGGLPVAAPRGAVFAEVLDRSGLLIDPRDPAASAAALLAFAGAPGHGRAARANVARWNALAAADAERFRAFLSRGPSVYGEDPAASVPPRDSQRR
ncbi:glycosyltransferase [Methylobacterium organophilum]|uniref:Uncharacterized protein n=1 Tax=Methylobacterium organophilum TaxID=410 RepID=A0ABQ4T3V8_METOR|nr:glycosyltransferase [Methylobacterium organophilum]GJE25898.1 hypothetical protein LKMONMHP_0741 [Methylobacterium organophilum]